MNKKTIILAVGAFSLAVIAVADVFNVAGGGSIGNPQKWKGGSVPIGGTATFANWGPIVTLDEYDTLTFSKIEFGNTTTGCDVTFDIGAGKSVYTTGGFLFNAAYSTTVKFTSGTWGVAEGSVGDVRLGDTMDGCTMVFDGPSTIFQGGMAAKSYAKIGQWSAANTTVVFTNGATAYGAFMLGPNDQAAINNLLKFTGTGTHYLFSSDCAAELFLIGDAGGNRVVVDDGATFKIDKNVPVKLGADNDNSGDKMIGSGNSLTVSGGASAELAGSLEIGSASHSNTVVVSDGGNLQVLNGILIGRSRIYGAKDTRFPTGNRLEVSGMNSRIHVPGGIAVGYSQAVQSEIVVKDGGRLDIAGGSVSLNRATETTFARLLIGSSGVMTVTNTTADAIGLYVGEGGSDALMQIDGGFYDGGTCGLVVGSNSGAVNSGIRVSGSGEVVARRLVVGNAAENCFLMVSNGTVRTLKDDLYLGLGAAGSKLTVSGTSSSVVSGRNLTTKNGAVLNFEIPAEGYASTPVKFLSFDPKDSSTTIRVRFSEDFPGGTVRLMESTRCADWDKIPYDKLTFDVEPGVTVRKGDYSVSVRKNSGLILILR